MPPADELLSQRVSELLDAVASDRPAPGGGSVAALAVALGAALAGMAARLSLEVWDEAADAVERAERLRALAAPLAAADAQAYAGVLEAMRIPDGETRGTALAEALGRAADVPLQVARAGAEAAAIAADAAELGNPNLRGDATAGALVAAAGARAAANLVAINLANRDGDRRIETAREHAAAADEAAARALAG